jgi:DNA anti-recombination protein RmuC
LNNERRAKIEKMKEEVGEKFNAIGQEHSVPGESPLRSVNGSMGKQSVKSTTEEHREYDSESEYNAL